MSHHRPHRGVPRRSRRRFLTLSSGVLGAAALVTWARMPGRGPEPSASALDPVEATPAVPSSTPTAALPSPTATPASTPAVQPALALAGREQWLLLPETPWATGVTAIHSGVEGPRVLVLGGVHGNEPGGWIAAEAITEWEVERGSLIVVPRANHLAVAVMERTLPELGDLNRLYPGDPEADLPMERLAAAIVALVGEYEVSLLLDLHESWGFYQERPQNGTAFLGQTVTTGADNDDAYPLLEAITAEVNERATERERLSLRRRSSRGRRGWPRSSSLSLSRHVPGVTPVLVEMGQQDQPVERRAELHQMLVAAALRHQQMLSPADPGVPL